jgi:hypothetical protein
MPVSMNGPLTVAVYVDMACDDPFTAQRCIKRIIFQCRFVVVFIVMVLAMVMSIMVVPLLTSMEMRKVMAMTVPVPAVLSQIAPCGNTRSIFGRSRVIQRIGVLLVLTRGLYVHLFAANGCVSIAALTPSAKLSAFSRP